ADDSTGSLHDKLAELGGKMIVDALRMLEENTLGATPQPEVGVTYAAKISKEEAALDFGLEADVLARKIRAFNPFPGAFGTFGGVTIKIWEAQFVAHNGHHNPGEIISADAQNGVLVACGKDALRLSVLQKPGGKRLPAIDFIRAFAMADGRFD
ncbi:methionyl-tRNA formyltransferase, partial [Glaciimonas sp. GG7]